jgi:type I restriction enzyme R subunit
MFYVAHGVEDEVESKWVVREGGEDYKPEDYLEAFARFVRENPAQIEAVRILLDRPKDWSARALTELRQKLTQTRRFRLENLEKAHEICYRRALVDIISMIKHAVNDTAPLLTAAERVERTFNRLTQGQSFTPEQQQWLDRIRIHMIENLSIDREDFDLVPVFTREGGSTAARRVFGGRLDDLIRDLNEGIAA